MRNDYRTMLKGMTDKELLRYIDRKIDYVLDTGEDLNRLTYAKSLAKKRNLINS